MASTGKNLEGVQGGLLACAFTGGKLAGWQNGLITRTDGSLSGFQLSFVGLTRGNFQGAQFGLGYAWTGETLEEAQIGLVAHASNSEGVASTGSLHGLQFGMVSVTDFQLQGAQFGIIYALADERMKGLQLGTVTQAGDTDGVQFGLLNLAKKARGLQIGLVNIAQDMHGLQIGLGNIIRSKGRFQGLPLVNWQF